LVATHFGPTIAVTTIATLLAVETGRGWGASAVAAAVLAGQCSVGWSNDYFDASRDRTANRTDKPIVAGSVTEHLLGRAAVSALVLAVALSFLSGWRAACVHVVALCSAWTYNAWAKSTWLSPLPYALSFGLLPAFVTLGLPGHPWPQPEASFAAGLLGLGAHFINTVDDAEADRLTGVRGFPQRIGVTGSLMVGVTMLAISFAMIALLVTSLTLSFCLFLGIGLISLSMVVVLTLRGDTRYSWRLTLVAALACVVLFATSGGSLVSH
jgi:4-hydroxybenzoate polyprenyltransferase